MAKNKDHQVIGASNFTFLCVGDLKTALNARSQLFSSENMLLAQDSPHGQTHHLTIATFQNPDFSLVLLKTAPLTEHSSRLFEPGLPHCRAPYTVCHFSKYYVLIKCVGGSVM